MNRKLSSQLSMNESLNFIIQNNIIEFRKSFFFGDFVKFSSTETNFVAGIGSFTDLNDLPKLVKICANVKERKCGIINF